MEEYDAVLHEIETATNHAPLETRIVENWAKMLAIYRCVSDRLQLPFGYKDIFKICKDGLVTQNNMSGEGNEVAKFWETIMYLRANGDIYEEGDFLIKDFKKFKSDIIAEKIYPEAHPVLLLNTSRIFTLYKENARRTGDKIIPEDALREYMKNADYYLGKVKSVRFKSIVKGIVEMRGSVSVSRVLQALAFDYNLLKERFSLNLDTTTSTDTVQEGDKETAQEADRRYGRKEEVCSSV